jgi:arsenate reductase
VYVSGPILRAAADAFAYQLVRGEHLPRPARYEPEEQAVAPVLLVCLRKAGCSQMTQAVFEQAADGWHTATSAGTTPGGRVHPEVVEVMRELGIEVADRRPQPLVRARPAGRCGGDDGLRRSMSVHSGLQDPEGRLVDEVRVTREESLAASSSCSPSWTPLPRSTEIRSYSARYSVTGADGSARGGSYR